MRTGKRTVTAGLLVCVAVAACNVATSEEDAASSEAANTEARQPLLAPTWTRCWIEKDTSTNDLARQQHAVKCRYDAPAKQQPIKPKLMHLDVRVQGGAGGLAQLEERSGEDVVVYTVRGDAFPLEINAFVHAPTFAAVGLGIDTIALTKTIEGPDAITSERPLEVKQPFDVWPVVVIPEAFLAYMQLDERTVAVAPYRVGVGAPGESTEASARGKIFARSSDSKPTLNYFVAPKEGGLEGFYRTAAGVGTQLTQVSGGARIPGPGVYVTTLTELRKATDEEAVAALRSLSPSSADDGGAIDAIASDASAADANAADANAAEASVMAPTGDAGQD